MKDSASDQQHFAKAVAELGETHDVISSQAIFNAHGVKIVDKGVAINLRLYERLMEHKLSAPLEDSVTSDTCVSGETLMRSADLIMRDTPFFGRMAHDGKARKLLLNVVETVPLPDAVALQLTVAHDLRPEIYLHLVRTALTAAWLAKTAAVLRFDIGMAAAGGLLHDVGMLHVDPLLLQPERRLNREQRRQLYSHPLLSTALVERHHQYSREVVRAVGEHHECLDGSGYPRNLTGDAISTLGRILSLSQAVAAMFAPGRSAPELRLSVLLRMTIGRYDSAMATQVMVLLRPELDVMSAEIRLLQDPIASLRDIDALLCQWPLAMPDASALAPARRQALDLVAGRATQMRRVLAGVGAVPEQLDQLGSAALDDNLQTELTLMTQEAIWQLRTLAREARRRWRAQAGEEFPAVFATWLDRVDNLVAEVSGQLPEEAGDSTAGPEAAPGE